MQITLETAKRLFQEANYFYIGKSMYLSKDSEIRKIAVDMFVQRHGDSSANVMQLNAVCAEIFRVLAEEHQRG